MINKNKRMLVFVTLSFLHLRDCLRQVDSVMFTLTKGQSSTQFPEIEATRTNTSVALFQTLRAILIRSCSIQTPCAIDPSPPRTGHPIVRLKISLLQPHNTQHLANVRFLNSLTLSPDLHQQRAKEGHR